MQQTSRRDEMAAQLCIAQQWDSVGSKLKNEPRDNLRRIKVPEQFSCVTHSFLKVADGDPGSPQPDDIKVKVFDASKVSNIELTLKSTDTTDTLTKKYLESRPELGGNLHLVYNGKPVLKQTSLRELGVKTGTTFLTYQKCHGG